VVREKVLFISPYVISEVRPRTLQNLKELSCKYAVTLVCLKDVDVEPEFSYVEKVIYIDNYGFMSRILRVFLGVFLGRGIIYSYYSAKWKLKKVLRDLQRSEGLNFKLIFVERLPIYEVSSELRGLSNKIVFDCVDSFVHQAEVFSAGHSGVMKLVYSIEKYLVPFAELRSCNAADLVLVTTVAEKKYLESVVGVNKCVKSYLHNIQSISPVSSLIPGCGSYLGFHGKLSYFPNRKALDVLNALGIEFNIKIAGSMHSEARAGYPELEFCGFVDDLQKFICGAKAGVFPVKWCVGIQNKVLEALACGVPVLITQEIENSFPKNIVSKYKNKAFYTLSDWSIKSCSEAISTIDAAPNLCSKMATEMYRSFYSGLGLNELLDE
jgi:glycosyltransferase involved in cell wall biosynthesis